MNICSYKTPYGDVEFPLYSEEVAISCSGGADSTILLHLLMMHKISPKVSFIDKAQSNLESLKKTIEYLVKRHAMNVHLEVIPRNEGEGHNLRPQIIELAKKYSYLYTGVTKNSDEVGGEGAPQRPSANPFKSIVTPFLHLDKRATIYLYFYLGLEDLLKLTHSCTEDLHTPCERCYACRERNWAIKEVLNDL